MSYALGEWLRTNEIERSTRETYEGHVSRVIRPALGETAVNKITARMLEYFYTELRPVPDAVRRQAVHRAPQEGR